ncbi:TetR/AcrR family transcriptional regulator [Actinomycetospora lemnae]|uniref:TetR/AcrR family transcriptional regulator n=1 Tax=Actinomycetospora lemnae TaxID=3019891 RepID=A0ABT5T0N7_9PSEU|nr:TetR/AcrR family transcriptional regulator [Actinomycetospora sp. DW7H6]MDD7968541.1 TetR/AcrR family transcriptional regulator [Actinomycetospora sp. DW7H6]
MADEHHLELLWGGEPPSGRGRPARTTREQVVAAGIARADAGGLHELSMRQVAADLGVGVMSLYTQVESRDGLVVLMIDRAFAEVTDTLGRRDGEPWRDAAARQARTLWDLYGRHPWILDHGHRMPMAPHVLALEDAFYTPFLDIGLPASASANAAIALRSLVTGLARDSRSEQDQVRRTGVGYAEYWSSLNAVFWDRYFDEERYPAMTRLWYAGGFAAEDILAGEGILERAVAAYLDGIAVRVQPGGTGQGTGGA